MHEESWKGIAHFPGFWISSYGRVEYRGDGREPPVLIEPYVGKDGDPWITFTYYGMTFDEHMSLLMLLNFYEGNSFFVDFAYHDGNRWNLDLDNIYPVHRDENGIGTPIRYRVGTNGMRRLDRRMKRKIRIIETGDVFNNVGECAEAIGGQTNTIYMVLRGAQKSHRGYTFEWIND